MSSAIQYCKLSLILLAASCLASCGGKTQTALARGSAAPPEVTVAVAAAEPVPIDLDAIGNAQPFRSVQLKSMVDGQIERVLLRQGEFVRAGQLLFQLDKRPFQAALDQARGRLSQDKATAAYNQAEAARDAALAQAGVIAPQVLQQQQALAQASQAAVQADRAAVETARVNLGYTDIRAPITARAGAILVNVGNLVKANDTNPLLTLNQVTPIYVAFSIPEAQLSDVQAKGPKPLEVQAFAPGETQPVAGMLTFVNNTVDPTTGTIQLMATFANARRRLWPGEYIKITMVLGVDPQATVVPATALQTGQNGKYVYVVQPDNTAVARTVASTRTYRRLAVIDRGIRPGERVVVDGQIRVVPDAKVTVARTVQVPSGPGPPGGKGAPEGGGAL